jgi:hypothetical protein
MNKVVEHIQSFKKGRTASIGQCKNVFSQTWGLPCAHTCSERTALGDSLRTGDFHVQWRLDRMRQLPPIDPMLWIKDPIQIKSRLTKHAESDRRELSLMAIGPDHTSTLNTVNNLGLLYRDQGKLAEAEKMYLRGLAGYEKALGPDHTSTLNTVCNLYAILVSCVWEAQSNRVGYNQPQAVNQLLRLACTWGSKVPNIFGALGRTLLWNSDEVNARIAFQQEIELESGVFVYASIHSR